MTQTDKTAQLDTRAVAEAVRRSRILDPVLKKHWLALLPHMREEDRRELWSVLVEGERQLDQLDAQKNAKS